MKLSYFLSRREYKHLLERPEKIEQLNKINEQIKKLKEEEKHTKNNKTSEIEKLNESKKEIQNNNKEIDFKIRSKALGALKTLEEIAKNFPEDQLEKIFTLDTMPPFLRALTDPRLVDTKEISENNFSEPFLNKRVFGICYLMENIGMRHAYAQLAPLYRQLLEEDRSYMDQIVPVRNMGREFWTYLKRG